MKLIPTYNSSAVSRIELGKVVAVAPRTTNSIGVEAWKPLKEEMCATIELKVKENKVYGKDRLKAVLQDINEFSEFLVYASVSIFGIVLFFLWIHERNQEEAAQYNLLVIEKSVA